MNKTIRRAHSFVRDLIIGDWIDGENDDAEAIRERARELEKALFRLAYSDRTPTGDRK